MSTTRYLVCLALAAACPAFAGEVAVPDLLEPGDVRQLTTTQLHLRAMQPRDETRRKPNAAALARLMGKMLSEHVKGLDLDLVDNDPKPAAPGLQQQPGAFHLNRRAEIVYDNYRFGIQRKGVMMRYETSF